jgi:CheY-like chemotaxis protein/GAF domain-containing protein
MNHPQELPLCADIPPANPFLQRLHGLTAALAEPGLKPPQRLALLQQRMDSMLALLRLNDAEADALARQTLAGSTGRAADEALALACLAHVQTQQQRTAVALATAAAASLSRWPCCARPRPCSRASPLTRWHRPRKPRATSPRCAKPHCKAWPIWQRRGPAAAWVRPLILVLLSQAELRASRPRVALGHSTQAVQELQAFHGRSGGGSDSHAHVWWQHACALQAGARAAAAADAMHRAYTLLVQSTAALADQGLRLNEQTSSPALHAFLIEEVAELLGARRVLLALEAATGPHVAGAQVPEGETADALLQAVKPWLEEARQTRQATLRHGPEGADELDQRGCLVAPLVAQQQLLGFVYADLEGLFGRFDEGDRDLLATLASQAAVALANLRTQEGLEREVAERTEALQERSDETQRLLKETEARNAERAVINSIQQGMAGSLNFQAIVDLVGSKLADIFDAQSVSLGLFDHAQGVENILFVLENGRRGANLTRPLPRSRQELIATREPIFVNRIDQDLLRRYGNATLPGTAAPRSGMFVPLIVGELVTGYVSLQNVERFDAFTQADLRLLQTVASSTSLALENARLYAETQAALQRQTASADILRAISQSPTDVMPVVEVIVATARQLLGCHRTALMLLQGGRFHAAGYATAQGSGPVEGTTPPFDPAHNFPSRALSSGAPHHVPDWSQVELPAWEGLVQQRTGVQASLMLPLRRGTDQHALGVLIFQRDQPRAIHRVAPKLPLVLFSSLGRKEVGDTEGHFSAYLAKPLRQSQLFDTLVTLLAGQAPKQAEDAKPKLDASMAQRHPLRILLAEDNVVNQKLAMRLLQQMGYRADLASNGIEAIESVERQPYDVVLMDVQMPEMDGLEASRRITSKWKPNERPRIVAMTANAMQGDRELCLAAGMDDYVTKPIRVDALMAALMAARPRV